MLHMLWQLSFLSYFAMVVVRFAIALLFLTDASALWKAGAAKKYLALLSVVVAFGFGVGAWTQAFALLGAGYALYLMLREPGSLFKNKATFFLALVLLLLLFVNGPGPFAIDLPY